MSTVIITIGDIRKAGICVRGARAWFGLHNLDFNAFLKNGINADVLSATGDEFALRVVAKKLEQTDG